MKIVYQTYLDHQQIIKYPIDFLKQRHGDLVIYVSDDEHKNLLSSYDTIVVDQKINVPGDIATAQNKCIDYTKKHFNPDFIVHVQADIYISSVGKDLINGFCYHANIDKSAHLRVQHVRLGMIADRTYFGATIIGNECKTRFIGDGAYLDAQNIIGTFDGIAPCYDIGYLTLEIYRNKLKRHSITWPDNINANTMTSGDIAKLACTRHYHDFVKQGQTWFEDMPESDIILNGMGILTEYKNTREYMRNYVQIFPVSMS